MRRRQRSLRKGGSCVVRTVIAMLVVVGLVSVAAAQEPPQETIEGDAQGWQEVKAAYERLTKLKSYRARHPGDPSLVEVVNPDRFHHIFAFGPIGIESIIVGGQYAERSATAGRWQPWRCFPARPNLAGC